jgi:NADH dehydrogenase [ubiquinone] 1 alpha subcomplex assembly factor 7
MGIDQRAQALASGALPRRDEIFAARDRLVSPEQMGTLFKVLALVSPGWPEPEGFR